MAKFHQQWAARIERHLYFLPDMKKFVQNSVHNVGVVFSPLVPNIGPPYRVQALTIEHSVSTHGSLHTTRGSGTTCTYRIVHTKLKKLRYCRKHSQTELARRTWSLQIRQLHRHELRLWSSRQLSGSVALFHV